jgi:hypothetical protein
VSAKRTLQVWINRRKHDADDEVDDDDDDDVDDEDDDATKPHG